MQLLGVGRQGGGGVGRPLNRGHEPGARVASADGCPAANLRSVVGLPRLEAPSPSDLQSCDVVPNMVNANMNPLVDRATMQSSLVEARAHVVVGVFEAPAVHNEPFHVVPGEGHRMKIRDKALGDFAATLTKTDARSVHTIANPRNTNGKNLGVEAARRVLKTSNPMPMATKMSPKAANGHWREA